MWSTKQMFLKKLAKLTGKHQHRSLLMKLQDGDLKLTILLKKDSGTSRNQQDFEEQLFIEPLWTIASGYIRILTAKNFQYQS